MKTRIKKSLSVLLSAVVVCVSMVFSPVKVSAANTIITQQQADAAVAWALARNGKAYTESSQYSNGNWSCTFYTYHYCTMFVRDAFCLVDGAGMGYQSTKDAKVWQSSWCKHTDKNEIPPKGALCFYDYDPNGHVAISLGDGRAISNLGGGTKIPKYNVKNDKSTYNKEGNFNGNWSETEQEQLDIKGHIIIHNYDGTDLNTGKMLVGAYQGWGTWNNYELGYNTSSESVTSSSNNQASSLANNSYDTNTIFKKLEAITKDSTYGVGKKFGSDDCFKYAIRVFKKIFDLDSEYYFKIVNYSNCTLSCTSNPSVMNEAVTYNKSTDSTDKIYNAISSLLPGDMVQSARSSGAYHTLLVYSVDTANKKITTLDCNLYTDESRKNRIYTTEMTYSEFLKYNKKIRAYRAANYPQKTNNSVDLPVIKVSQNSDKYSQKYVQIIADSASVVYYTTNGTTPTTKSNGGKSNTVKFYISKDATIKAIAVKNSKSSSVSSKTVSAALKFGDVDGNGKVNKNDLTALNEFLAGTRDYFCSYNSDVNGDGRVDSTDAGVLSDRLNGKITSFPVEAKPTITLKASDGYTHAILKTTVKAAKLYYSTDKKTYHEAKNNSTLTVKKSCTLYVYSEVYGQKSSVISKKITVSAANTTSSDDKSQSSGSITTKHTSITLKKIGAQNVMIVTFNDPNTKDRTLSFKSSNNAVATVDKDGVITAVSSGTCTITATAADGSTVSCKVTVK